MLKSPMSDKIDVQNINHPDHIARVDAAKYHAMRRAYLSVLDAAETPLSHAEAKEAILPLLPDDLFPGGKTAGWWIKTVQLDLEAKGVVARHATKPLRFSRAG